MSNSKEFGLQWRFQMVDSTGLEPVTPCTSSIMGLPPQSIDISRVSTIHKPRRCHAGATHQPNKAMGRRN